MGTAPQLKEAQIQEAVVEPTTFLQVRRIQQGLVQGVSIGSSKGWPGAVHKGGRVEMKEVGQNLQSSGPLSA